SERVNLQDYWNRIQKEGQARLDQMREAMGLNTSDRTSSLTSTGIERVTEQTATELMGVSRAHLDVSKQNLVALQKALEFEARANDLLVNSLRHLAAIEANTGETVAQLRLVVEGVRNTNRNLGGK